MSRSHRRRRRRIRSWLAVAATATLVAASAPAAAQPWPAPATVRFSPPVDAPVVDGWRPPDGPYAPGNRGWEYRTEPGAVVRAAGAGTVTFAGPVGDTRAVTVAHGGGLATTYTHLAAVDVHAGAAVARGAPIGVAGERLHFGVRLRGAYVDPAVLFRPGALRFGARLLPDPVTRARPGPRSVRLHSRVGLPAGGPTTPGDPVRPESNHTPHRVLPRSPRAPGPGRATDGKGERRWPLSA
jgi:murein DD-endopeptidase MepM/ murein hydrolase activator NlpD